MRDLLDELRRWLDGGRRVALARVVDLEGSGPRQPGAAMAVSDTGEVVGSVSGGCVESAVVAEALDVLASGERRLVSFGYSDDDAFAVGLTCGGTVHLFVEPLDWYRSRRQERSDARIRQQHRSRRQERSDARRRQQYSAMADAADRPVTFVALRAAIESERPAVLVTVVTGPGTGSKVLLVEGEEPAGRLDDPGLDRVVRRDAAAALASATTSVRRYGEHGEANEDAVTVFFEAHAPPPKLLIFGAVDFTAALVRVAKVLGYRVTVCDAREVFATKARFPLADEVVVDWPHRHLETLGPSLTERDAICVLTHDAKFDVPAIVAALGTKVGYLGAMGSRRTTDERAERLRAAGVAEQQLARLMAPIGLDLGARTPEETAVAICAEMITCRTGATAPSLRDAEGPIH